MANQITKSDSEWKAELTEEEYAITRQGGTEAPFSGTYWNHKEDGTYRCTCCGAPLFSSSTKFESGTGWPSFTAPVASGNVETELDTSHGMRRTEVKCHQCGAHLGHVFDDGPAPTGKRFCINSAALQFEASEKESDH